MNSQYGFACHKNLPKNKTTSSFISFLCLLTILGLGIVCYDDDLMDNNNPPVIAFHLYTFIYHNYSKITIADLITESINLPLVNKKSFLTRAPPA